ncbi:hypothetical protein L1887_11956 [Cichorium endivia]|nr:hypothetical protein L1887_11956 [Cichorium endivia]
MGGFRRHIEDFGQGLGQKPGYRLLSSQRREFRSNLSQLQAISVNINQNLRFSVNTKVKLGDFGQLCSNLKDFSHYQRFAKEDLINLAAERDSLKLRVLGTKVQAEKNVLETANASVECAGEPKADGEQSGAKKHLPTTSSTTINSDVDRNSESVSCSTKSDDAVKTSKVQVSEKFKPRKPIQQAATCTCSCGRPQKPFNSGPGSTSNHVAPKRQTCYNCGTPGHIARNCPQHIQHQKNVQRGRSIRRTISRSHSRDGDWNVAKARRQTKRDRRINPRNDSAMTWYGNKLNVQTAVTNPVTKWTGFLKATDPELCAGVAMEVKLASNHIENEFARLNFSIFTGFRGGFRCFGTEIEVFTLLTSSKQSAPGQTENVP